MARKTEKQEEEAAKLALEEATKLALEQIRYLDRGTTAVRACSEAANHRLPLIIHCVRAWDKLFAMQKEMPAGLTCIIHGFRGKPELAGSLLHHGFYLSFGFHFHPQSLSLCPPERLFLETDEDRRHVEVLYHTAAALHACSPDSLRIQCHKNFERITAPSKK